ncbi:hypothetical protein H9L05_09735 [Hymenobacter qilianensis]|uniref:Uncharacterized protein n=1 Tax=Hymenobacter qilianensis TaxID=1385715 RepID=A0A7H0GZR8_9BACT|nr:tetratricopeptide repeat protein [Hymenobacter qilianensis]QNP53784.1 hypothetical protein H9L05_09735 [Hymenobacter qilianensis]
MSRISALVFLLISLLFAVPAWAQQSAPAKKDAPSKKSEKPEKPRKLSRREKKELSRRAEVEAAQLRVGANLSDRDRDMSESYFVDGVKYVLLEDYNKALERLLKAYALNPTNAAINYKIAETNLLSGNLKDATNFAQAAVRYAPRMLITTCCWRRYILRRSSLIRLRRCIPA